MKICLVGYIDNTPENREMFETYELKNDFWAERIKFRRRDGKQVDEDELKRVSAWISREIVDKHRTNWLSEKNPEYIDVTDPAVVKHYCPWMSDEQIQERLESERRHKFCEKMCKEVPPDEWERMVMANPPTYYPTPPSMAKQLELRFED